MLRSIYRPIALLLISLFPFAAMAEILEVYEWKANPGMGQQMFETMAGAKQIHETLGVRVDVYGLQVGSDGSVHYVMRFDSMADWGSKKDAIASSAEWMEFYAEAGKKAASELQSSLFGINLDESVKASSFDDLQVFNAFVWDPAPGKTGLLVSRMAEAKQLHEGLGARIDIYAEGIGGTGNYHYIVSFKNWTDMAAFTTKLNGSKAWAKFNSESDPTAATLIKSFSGQRAPL